MKEQRKLLFFKATINDKINLLMSDESHRKLYVTDRIDLIFNQTKKKYTNTFSF